MKHVEGSSCAVSKIVVYAIGGNALAPPGGASGDEHAMILAQVMSDVVDLLEADWSVVLTHGNGPQVGKLMTMDADLIHTMDEWVAATQGMIGHTLSLQLNSILSHRHRPERTAVVLTRVLVDADDEAFTFPTKPVGPVLSAEEVMARDWDIATTINGPRRVVASPMPMSVLDIDVIRTLVQQRAVVICGGGGGIPIINDEKQFKGVPSVIDKDRLSALLASELGAEALIISTGVEVVFTDFGSDEQKEHRTLSVSQAEKFLAEGHFPEGSMGPKISSMIEAVRHSPKMRSILCKPGDALSALREEAGTTLSHDD